MENLFLKYMDARFKMAYNVEHHKKPGPVITISRVSGCSANIIAEMLTDKINQSICQKEDQGSWRWISKEILSMASQELKIHPEKVRQSLESHDKNFVEELVSSFTETYYAHSAKVKKVTEELIRNMAEKGHVVIVGRASGIITADIEQSLHVHLEAPLSWRTTVIERKHNFSSDEAKKYVINMDKQREEFKAFFKKKDYQTPDYDLSINCKTLTMEQVCDLIFEAAKIKKMF